MKRPLMLAAAVACGLPASAPGHDLFFRAPRRVFAAGDRVVVDVLNGTFSRSDNAITRDRLQQVVLVGPKGSRDIPLEQWTEADPKSTVAVTLAEEGTHVLGAAVRPRMLELKGPEFMAYLREEGLEDVVAARTAQKRLDEPSRERYSKFVKALLQAGGTASPLPPPLGHAAEIVPEQNPYALHPGDRLTVRCLVEGKPWAGKVVFAGGRRASGEGRFTQQRLVTDAEGRAVVTLAGAGSWYVKMVAMQEVADAEANYESRWATLSFAVWPSRGR